MTSQTPTFLCKLLPIMFLMQQLFEFLDKYIIMTVLPGLCDIKIKNHGKLFTQLLYRQWDLGD